MSDGTVFFLLLLIGIAVAGWLGFCVGDDHGWRFCTQAWKRAIVDSNAVQAKMVADSKEAVDSYLSAQRTRNQHLRHPEEESG